jgi:transglutaminase-like putative cysteine protease
MNNWLARSRYCDWDHAAIRGVAEELTNGVSSRRSAACLFRFVRDHVRYAFGPWGVLASTTLALGEGTCANKSNLLVALFRAAGIPAGYGVLRVNAREYFGNIAPPYLKHLASEHSIHIYAAAFLEARWVRCDASTDRELAEKTAHFCPQTRLVEWDGEHDALDFLDPAHIHADLGVRPAVDDLLDKPPRNANAHTLSILNDYLRFIRGNRPFPSAERLIASYRSGWAPVEVRQR